MVADPPRVDAQELLWTGVTVRVAWDLHAIGVKVSPALVSEAREHVFLCLPPGVSPVEAEEQASLLAMDFVSRVRQNQYARAKPVDPPLPRVDVAWRESIESACDTFSLAVFRLRYTDGLAIPAVARSLQADPVTIQAAVEGLRTLARMELNVHGADVLGGGSWVDAVLSRIASTAGDDCPPVSFLVTNALVMRGGRDIGGAVAHVGRCPRCSRLARLVRAGVLDAQLLHPPATVPPATDTLRLVALHFHPQARAHRVDMQRALGAGTRSIGDDTLVIDVDGIANWAEVVHKRVRMGLPVKHYLRGGQAAGPGRWARRAILGAIPLDAVEASRAQNWGEVDGIEALPDPLPPPPNVARWWSTAIVAGLMAAVAGIWALVPPGPRISYPIEGSGLVGGGAVIARFDLEDSAFVNIYAVGRGSARVVLESRSAADKAEFATGDGDYEMVTLESLVIVVSSAAPLGDLAEALNLYLRDGEDDDLLRSRLQAIRDDVDVLVFRDSTRR